MKPQQAGVSFEVQEDLESYDSDSSLERLRSARANTDRLLALVKEEHLYERPIAERHRIVFYIGHLEAFDWNLFQPRVSGVPIFNAAYDRLFAFGIDPVDGGLPTDQPNDWPSLTEVIAYKTRVRESLDSVLLKGRAISETEPLWLLLNIAIEHRLMHAETLAYMLHQLPLEWKKSESQIAVEAAERAVPDSIFVPAGHVTLGMRSTSGRFGWDNEFEAQRLSVPAFTIDRYKTTNRQFLEFLDSGGYQNQLLWSPAAWQWKNESRINHPVFWKRETQGWKWRTMFADIPLPLDWPVYVSHAEAAAFARWAGKRLPTEAEWQYAAYGNDEDREYPWGNDAASEKHGVFDFARWDPYPVNAFPASRSAFNLEGMLANGWEWTSSEFAPLNGFRAFSFYPGYSANFFDGEHFVLKGGSARTAPVMLRRAFRNWFQAHYQYAYSGFRCVEN